MTKAPKTKKYKVAYSLSEKTLEEIERLSELRQLPRSTIIQLAIEQYVKHDDNVPQGKIEIIQNE